MLDRYEGADIFWLALQAEPQTAHFRENKQIICWDGIMQWTILKKSETILCLLDQQHCCSVMPGVWRMKLVEPQRFSPSDSAASSTATPPADQQRDPEVAVCSESNREYNPLSSVCHDGFVGLHRLANTLHLWFIFIKRLWSQYIFYYLHVIFHLTVLHSKTIYIKHITVYYSLESQSEVVLRVQRDASIRLYCVWP